MTTTNRFEAFKAAFEALSINKQIELFNEMTEKNQYENTLFDMDFLDEYLANVSPTEIIRKTDNEGFNIRDDYFYDTIYGLLSVGKYEVEKFIADYLDDIYNSTNFETVIKDFDLYYDEDTDKVDENGNGNFDEDED